jgi:hypothetical protein
MVRIGARSSRSRVARGGKTMALFRRNKTWWTDFSVNGQRFRMSLDTTDWRDSLKEEKKLIVQAQTGKLSAAGQSFARLAFTEAAERYLDSRKLELSDRSLEKERQLLVQPSRFFGAMSLARITTENLLAYRESRAKSGTGPAYVNMEWAQYAASSSERSGGTLLPKTFTR